MKKIPYGRQNITEEDIQAVVDILKSDFLTQGPIIAEFESAFSSYIGCKYAVAVSNGTAALHLCALALDIKSGDKVITTPITFAATANCVRYAGGDVVFADIDPNTYLLDIKEVEKKLKSVPKGTYKGIIPVDFAGRAVNLEAFRKLADEYGCWIIEDSCHAPGGFFIDSMDAKHNCGNGQYAELAIFSFHPVKHIAAGEGGMITTNDENLYHRLRNLRTHGIQQNPNLKQFNHGAWYYEMQELGYNYRLTDFQAALAISQLKRAKEGIKKRINIASVYEKAFAGKSFIKKQVGLVEGHAYHLYVVEVENRNGLYDHLRNYNIFPQIHYIPVHLMPYYRQFGWKEGDFPIAESYYNNCLSIPIFPTLTEEDQKFVIEKVFEFFC
ncbi:MAG: UDP-4-amino-4,6-dideoxy-N-acetyl-beta-L-altrosamine transaminase [Bacteroidetes bacterium RIFOXYA12_FULL_35_11]|nr:MAG: UDP-4-amino-4,6-dideoxy-N-acetyl-beta-L-altrosamine transaminase [Bacteroidetes bacterium GWF2_35_48]OFY73054.1 MAG: UDP-4-amino-4,6-dideoxy-N-acetyl-beta-L-altrosamine transaminase [Bacteroidetes bacterium RIFOXYA12_FULL_35_11]OFY93942.1 MAG: UDP-4-amino-4,6-dideoxy-N-acetyl-beta-L-altrosamine transaminase [Bacteroidetes bacterium RIFOXYC12_FULL_35_7]OFY97841.1 MAG: UDP-4-amino-4,6-dideoxy-N-acetyl-beta-L-altrosamine transaminase [Bacteroidetes bacterium RIFOXYB2_FULL_35_7]HBX53549.1 U